MAKERDELMGHGAENDGIEEYDNPLPDWWLGLFFFSIVWAVGYAVDYHYLSDRSQVGYYLAEVEAAEQRWPAPAAPAVADLSPETIAKGEALFKTNCTACHGAALEGGIGPNLTDAEWIHGGTLAEITKVVTEGVPDKGMLTWGPILGAEKIAQISAFVYTKGPQLGLEPPSATQPDEAPLGTEAALVPGSEG